MGRSVSLNWDLELKEWREFQKRRLKQVWYTVTYGSHQKFEIFRGYAAAAAAKSLQSCPTLCDPIDVSPPGSPVPGILRARTLEWVAISLTLIRHIQNWAHLYSQAFSFSFSVVSSNTTILWVILSHKYKKHFQFSLGTSCVINHQSLLISLLTVFSPATPLTFSFNNYSLR